VKHSSRLGERKTFECICCDNLTIFMKIGLRSLTSNFPSQFRINYFWAMLLSKQLWWVFTIFITLAWCCTSRVSFILSFTSRVSFILAQLAHITKSIKRCRACSQLCCREAIISISLYVSPRNKHKNSTSACIIYFSIKNQFCKIDFCFNFSEFGPFLHYLGHKSFLSLLAAFFN